MASEGSVKISILGPDGKALPPAPRTKVSALSRGSGFGTPPFDAADLSDQHMAAWTPFLWSPDAERNIYRDRIVARVRDIVRNDGWASGAVTRILDNAVGANLRPIAKPDHRFLAQYSGNSAYDHAWAKEYAQALNAYWCSWAHDPMHWCDLTRTQTFGQMMRIAFRHKLIDGDSLAIMHWKPKRVSRGRARYATCVQLIDPDRLSNPQLKYDQKDTRGGVKIDDDGCAIGYYIRRAHAGDWFAATDSIQWDLIPRETAWGRPIVVHDFECDRATQHRGGTGIFTPVLQRLKMLIKYDGTELDAAIINAIFAAYIESPFDAEMVQEALDDGERLHFFQQQRSEFHQGNNIMLGNSRIPILFPGEKINAVANQRAGSNFKDFESAFLRNVATGVGLSAQQVTNDWSGVNYSSARGALLEAWKTIDRRRDDFASGFAAPVRMAWIEEAMAVDDLPLPNDAVDFIEARAAYSRCRWMGPGRGWVDPVAEKQGAVIGMDAALSTLEDECAAQGLDFEEVLEQRRYELGLFDEYNIPRPQWAGQFVETESGAGPSQDKKATPPKPQAV